MRKRKGHRLGDEPPAFFSLKDVLQLLLTSIQLLGPPIPFSAAEIALEPDLVSTEDALEWYGYPRWFA